MRARFFLSIISFARPISEGNAVDRGTHVCLARTQSTVAQRVRVHRADFGDDGRFRGSPINAESAHHNMNFSNVFSGLQLWHNDSVLSEDRNSNKAKMMPLFVADVFHLAGEFRLLGESIAGRVGQTQARWQVLSVISDGTWTVAQIARRLGYARQSVQRTSDQLSQQNLAAYRPNPDHAKSPILEITNEGKLALARITREADKWHLKLSAGLEGRDLATAAQVIRHLCAMLENDLGKKRVRDR